MEREISHFINLRIDLSLLEYLDEQTLYSFLGVSDESTFVEKVAMDITSDVSTLLNGQYNYAIIGDATVSKNQPQEQPLSNEPSPPMIEPETEWRQPETWVQDDLDNLEDMEFSEVQSSPNEDFVPHGLPPEDPSEMKYDDFVDEDARAMDNLVKTIDELLWTISAGVGQVASIVVPEHQQKTELVNRLGIQEDMIVVRESIKEDLGYNYIVRYQDIKKNIQEIKG